MFALPHVSKRCYRMTRERLLSTEFVQSTIKEEVIIAQ